MLKREFQLCIRCTDAEKKQILENAGRLNHSVREYILNRSLPRKDNDGSILKAIRQLTAEVKQISHSLNIMARNANPTDQSLEENIKQCYESLDYLGENLEDLIMEVKRNGYN